MAYGGFMTKLKEESNKLNTAIKELENELSKLNKNEIKNDINLKSKMNNLLENVEKNNQLLRVAQIRAKNVIEEKIKSFANEYSNKYTIEWEYEE